MISPHRIVSGIEARGRSTDLAHVVHLNESVELFECAGFV